MKTWKKDWTLFKMTKSNEPKPLTVKQAGDKYNAVIRAEVRTMAEIQERVAELNVKREEALKALNLAIVEEERKKAQAKVDKRTTKVDQT